jgi:hypothetical protein
LWNAPLALPLSRFPLRNLSFSFAPFAFKAFAVAFASTLAFLVVIPAGNLHLFLLLSLPLLCFSLPSTLCPPFSCQAPCASGKRKSTFPYWRFRSKKVGVVAPCYLLSLNHGQYLPENPRSFSTR